MQKLRGILVLLVLLSGTFITNFAFAQPIITVTPLEITLELNSAAPDLLVGVSTDDGSPITTTGTVDTTTLGDYIITYDSTDGTTPAISATRTYHVVDTTISDSMTDQLLAVKNILVGLKDTTDDKTDKKLDKIIEKIDKAVNAKYWNESGNQLISKDGKKAFEEIKKAVDDMLKISKKGDLDYPEITNAVDMLVKISKQLATDALNDAQAFAGDKKTDKEIEKSNKELDKAQKDLDNKKPDKAIDKYKKAWEHAQKAIKEKKVKDLKSDKEDKPKKEKESQSVKKHDD